jgi:hypothetical protein
MRTYSAWAGVLALALTSSVFVETQAGVVMITTRKNMDTAYGTDRFEIRGPGMTSPGDVAMGILLGNHGYSSRLVVEVLLASANPLNERTTLLAPSDPAFNISLIIMSGSSTSADVPEPPTAEGIPVMMCEHATLGNRTDRAGSIFMYNGQNSSDPNEGTGATKYMKVIAPNHPIMQGIPLDSQSRVKIFRERYPNEEKGVPMGGRPNYEYRWCTQAVADAVPDTTILGVLDGAEDRSCLAVVDVGGTLANGSPATARLVHMFTNENGSSGSRRVFLALTELGQAIFVRAARWAMGETLEPHPSFQIASIQRPDPKNIMLSWAASSGLNYKIQASTDFSNWQTVVEDLIGVDGNLSHTMNVEAAPQTLFFRVAAIQ